MEIKRLRYTIRLWMTLGSGKRTKYLRKKKIFASIGENCSIMDRKVPLYANLIRIGNNVHIASKVDFITHDITHVVLNNLPKFAGGVLIHRKRLVVSKSKIMSFFAPIPPFSVGSE